jgi:CheY-like chemotaxis protein
MKQVLIVDDDAAVRGVVTLALKRHGYRVTAASSGAECLERARTGFRGVILMDVMMPGLNGWQTIRAMDQEHLLEGNAVCMLTGIPYPSEESAGLEEKVLDYLRKPFDGAALVRMVEEAETVLG